MKEKKQAKIFELQNLIAQYNSGERISINVSEYPVWVKVLEMLNQAGIEENIFDDFIINPTHYIIKEGEIVFNENWEADEIKAKEDAFNKAFFETTLGYIRREVTMQNGATKTFLTDMLPQLVSGFPILAYDKPDFAEAVDMVDYQKQVFVTDEFLLECKNQLIIDFYGFNPMEQ